jgi:hypothetical protein
MRLEEIARKLNGSLPLSEVLGADLEAGAEKLQLQCHPDRNPDNPKLAGELFIKVTALLEAVRNPEIVRSPVREYSLNGISAMGDVADVYYGSGDSVVKISRVKGAHGMLEREQLVLETLLKEAHNSVYRKGYPEFIESFPVKDAIQKRVNVFKHHTGYCTLTELMKYFPDGLIGQHIGWLFRRVLTSLAFAHAFRILHCAVTPDHIMVNIENHAAMLVGWGQSVDLGGIVKYASSDWKAKDWYPTEILCKKGVTPATDIYMAAKCMRFAGLKSNPHVYGTDEYRAEDQVSRFVDSCLLEGQLMRPQGAFELHDRFGNILESIYGPPKFVPLVFV